MPKYKKISQARSRPDRVDECINCGKPYYGARSNKSGQWWGLRNYFNAPDGLWCPKCYDLIAHDAYQTPKNPKEYERILIMHALKNGVKHA